MSAKKLLVVNLSRAAIKLIEDRAAFLMIPVERYLSVLVKAPLDPATVKRMASKRGRPLGSKTKKKTP